MLNKHWERKQKFAFFYIMIQFPVFCLYKLCPGQTVAMFSGEYARSCNSSLLVAYSWSIFTVLQHSPWIVIWLRQFQTVQNYCHASSISLQFFTDGGGFVDFVAPSYPNSPLRSRLLHCSSLFANFPLKIVG